MPITIGWGSTRNFDGKPFKITDTINIQNANLLIEHQIKTEFLPALEKIPYWSEMNDNQQGCLLSFAYNLGADFYGNDGFYTITCDLSNKNWKAIPKTLELYRNPGTNVEAGLLRRRIAEGTLWSKK